MFNRSSLVCSRRLPLLALLLVAAALSGCASKEDKALDLAKKQAAATGLAQQESQ
jgi:hypothetical protein